MKGICVLGDFSLEKPGSRQTGSVGSRAGLGAYLLAVRPQAMQLNMGLGVFLPHLSKAVITG